MKSPLKYLGLVLLLATAQPVYAQIIAGSGAGLGGGGGTPVAGANGDWMYAVSALWTEGPMLGDLNCATTPGTCVISGQEGLTYTGNALSSSVAGQVRVTDGTGHMITVTLIKQINFGFVGAPFPSAIWGHEIPSTLSVNANFAGSGTGSSIIPVATASCSTNPAETDTYTIKCIQSSVLTTIGTIALNTSCVPTLATTGGIAQTCTNGRVEIDGPATVSGAGESIAIYLHN